MQGQVLQVIALPGAELQLAAHWLDGAEADALLAELQGSIPWEIHRIRMFGREVDSPRLSCWIGDPGTGYTYSRTRFEPNPWPPLMASLRARVETACAARFNSVLANLYRDGRDSMGWHSDNEPELGARPVIASLSLGAVRTFRLRPRAAVAGRREVRALELPHGSLLCMGGDTQRLYQHDLPKVHAAIGARINLTFRYVHSTEQALS
ncbi:alpha-ketoglutarate-dependent dioxygenase AlkB family protein [Dyella tabacisoli]|uniref:Alpha-ketoglutarate-dependent dioxygenase AlkB n=1 Tax=Dyella tabacisoli TaxID=2282381 RepID=A0A369UJB2_9GAMM|nr:alpha-ketoglutarate-dependent dioxygenase AlkB [Dyella tabacisoli]RDD80626.1 alpha-ketoglutarate-dependent dioxygenase AlkB [Dyella tabacisoli]